jgi:hypothetical protein
MAIHPQVVHRPLKRLKAASVGGFRKGSAVGATERDYRETTRRRKNGKNARTSRARARGAEPRLSTYHYLTAMRNQSTLRAPLLIALIAMLALSSCSRFVRHGTPQVAQSTVTYGGGSKSLPKASSPKRNQASSKLGVIVVRITDESGTGIAGVITRLKGPKKYSKSTDANGRARVTVTPGTYHIDVAPCGSTAITDSYAEGDAVVGAGQTIDALLPSVDWHLRYRPEAAVKTSDDPPWARGSNVTLRVRIADGCDISRTASGVSIASYAWKVSSNFAIVSAGVRAGSDGYAAITVRCTSAGDGSIVIRNRRDAADQVDLLLAGSPPPEGEHWCR